MNSHPASLASRYLCLVENELCALSRFPLHGATHEALRVAGVSALIREVSALACAPSVSLASYLAPFVQSAMRAEVSRASRV